MNNDNPQSINDDYVRTWTISSSPPFDPNTNTFKATNKISCTIKHLPKGVMSSLLHSRSLNQQPSLSVKFVGVGGEFTCFDESNQTPQKLLFVAGGVGLTPFLPMLEALSQTKQKVDIVVLFAGRRDEIDLLKDFISSPLV
jgi:ferredoxin-NADP reductase